ncbi:MULTISPECIES: nuclease-related domain-containing DEAD/DEAH box helicase [unclassified Methanoregula]|uniref:NERD domain-containing protein n=1 Tax=unclassified Methanoregula TaxID=2649730 RepID=UPI0009CA5DDF|nr:MULTISPECIES: nuclease-related domain-containing DEAD/DEAH box helicase [unclassified Methanoregula]OPX62556.1 MAG: Nuclease-related domain protein [Methanoregula sp. PtaB.Bin085]OPY31655.1 MAG: Nuclease-related domain protein [Methanoregula sp. PtaU1.Bin006]
MAIRIFIGNTSENRHEILQQHEIIDVLKKEHFDDDIYLLLNFNVKDSTEIDCVIFTSSGPVLLELKKISGEIHGELNGDWKAVKKNGNEYILPRNLLHQLKKERSKFNQSLLASVRPLLADVKEEDIMRTEAWGYFPKGSVYKGSITRSEVSWFDLVTMDTLGSKLFFENAPLIYTNAVREKFISDLHLTEFSGDILPCDQYDVEDEVTVYETAEPPAPYNSTTDTEPLAQKFCLLESSLTTSTIKLFSYAKQIPEGPQRIRGVAGSGKTMLLCQKAAHMHSEHPEWDIALVFYTQSLYHEIEQRVRESVGRLGGTWDPNKLRILHAWGSMKKPGFYSTIRDFHQAKKIPNDQIPYSYGVDELAFLSKKLLETTRIAPMFDAVLIDEGQDLITEKPELLHNGKQPIIWLAYQALKSLNPDNKLIRRLIWAYDEYQCTFSQKIPTAGELFGNDPDLMKAFSGMDKNGVRRSVIMKKCCRTPGPVLVAAHTLGMGLLYKDGMLAGPTSKEEWEALGYEVDGVFRANNEITLSRPERNSRNILSRAYPSFPFVGFKGPFVSKQEEYAALASSIEKMCREDYLDPMRQLLIIPLDFTRENLHIMAEELAKKKINYYNVTAPVKNVIDFHTIHGILDKFREEFCVTISSVARAKGNESDVVFVTDLEKVARNEADVNLRNQLFISMTRTRGLVNISGTGEYPLYNELREIIQSSDQIKFTYRGKPKIARNCYDEEVSDTRGYQEELAVH